MSNHDILHAFINGQWVRPTGTEMMPICNPANEEVIGQLHLGRSEDVDMAVQAAGKAFIHFGQTSKADRLDLLHRLRVETEKRMEDMAQAMRLEMGAPIDFARAYQADAALGHLDGFISALRAQDARQTLDNGDVLLHEPIGVVGLITPWNWPINQIALKVLPALATGCTMVLKPSEYTPVSAQIYAEIIEAAGYPAGVFNMIHGTGLGVGEAISSHPDIQMVSFTGSTRAGVSIATQAAPTIKKVTLELGGKSPNLLFADADLDKAIPQALEECFLNTGQSCDAPTRLLVERAIYDEVCARAAEGANQTKVGDPASEGNHLGPLFDKIQFDRVQDAIQAGLDEGARLVAGGLGRPEGYEKGWYVKPTVFVDVHNDMHIAQHEIFGPVLVIIPFDSEDEAITIANDTPYGLAGFVQTSDREKAERVAAKLRVGAVHINGGVYQYGSPFGGYKASGNGREGGIWGLEDFQEIKTLHYG